MGQRLTYSYLRQGRGNLAPPKKLFGQRRFLELPGGRPPRCGGYLRTPIRSRKLLIQHRMLVIGSVPSNLWSIGCLTPVGSIQYELIGYIRSIGPPDGGRAMHSAPDPLPSGHPVFGGTIDEVGRSLPFPESDAASEALAPAPHLQNYGLSGGQQIPSAREELRDSAQIAFPQMLGKPAEAEPGTSAPRFGQ
jgi:hypothetical protein